MKTLKGLVSYFGKYELRLMKCNTKMPYPPTV